MPRPGITYLDVAKAAATLFEQNIRPSIEGVRQLLGTGSNSTINRHLREWRDKQGNQMECEQGLPESLLISVKGIYEALKEESSAKIDAIKRDADKTIADLQTQLNEMNSDQSQLMQNKQSLEEAVQVGQEEKSALQRSLDEVKKKGEKQSHEIELLQSRIQDKASEIERILKQLNHAQRNLDHYRESIRQDREADRHYFEEKIAALEKQRQSQAEQVLEKEQKIAALTQQITLFKEDKNNLNQKCENMVTQCRQSEIEIQKNKINYRHLEERYVKITEDHKKLTEKTEFDAQTIHQLILDNERRKARISVLEKLGEKTEDIMRNFTDKNLFLMQEKTALEAQLKQVLATQ